KRSRETHKNAMAVTQQAVAGMRQLRDNRDENAAPTGLDSLELVSVMTITPPARRRSYEAPAGTRGSGLGGYEVPSPEPWAVSLSLSRSERACHPERRRREGPAFRERRATAGPSLARVPQAPFVPRSSASRSFARARAARSLRMTTPRRFEGIGDDVKRGTGVR